MIVHAKSGAWLINLAGEDNQNLAEAMLQRALEVNGLIQNAYRPNENYGDQGLVRRDNAGEPCGHAPPPATGACRKQES